MKSPYEQGYERGYYNLVYIEMYDEYSTADIEFKQGWLNGRLDAQIEVDKHNEFVDNMKRERMVA